MSKTKKIRPTLKEEQSNTLSMVEQLNRDIPNLVYSQAEPVGYDKSLSIKFEEVSKYSLEYLIDSIIFKCREDINFFQYNEYKNYLYVYVRDLTNNVQYHFQTLQNEWNDRVKNKIFDYKDMTLEDEIRWIKTIFSPCNTCPKDCVPISHLLNGLKTIKRQYFEEERKIKNKLKEKLKSRHNIELLFFYPQGYSEKHLKIKLDIGDTEYHYELKYDGNNIQIVTTNDQYYFTDLLPFAYNELLAIFQLYKKFLKIIFLDSNFNLKTFSNVPFFIEKNIFDTIKIKINSGIYIEIKNFNIDTMKIISDQSSTIEIIKGNDKKMLDKLYVRIDDCPAFLRDTLYNNQRKVNISKIISQKTEDQIVPLISLREKLANLFNRKNSHDPDDTPKEDNEALEDNSPVEKIPLTTIDSNFIQDLITEQKEKHQLNIQIRFEEIEANIKHYLVSKFMNHELNLYQININEIYNPILLRQIISIFYLEKLRIWKINRFGNLEIHMENKSLWKFRNSYGNKL